MIEVESSGIDFATQRFGHIGKHFDNGTFTADWICVDLNGPKGEQWRDDAKGEGP